MQKFWQDWVAEPLETLWLSFDKPFTFKKRFEAIPQSERKKYQIRWGIVATIFNTVVFSLVGLLLLALGYKFTLFLAIPLALITFVLFLFFERAKENLIAAASDVTGLLLILVSCGVCFSYDIFENKLPLELALLTIILMGCGWGMDYRYSKKDFVRLILQPILLIVTTNNLIKGAINNYWITATFVFIFFLAAVCRVPSYLDTRLSVRKAWYKSLREPTRSLEFLRASKFYSNEAIILPLPEAEKILRQAARYDWSATFQELAWLIKERPHKATMAKNIVLDKVWQDLKERKTLLDIAGASERLTYLVPDSSIFGSAQLEEIFYRLHSISDKVSVYCRQLGVNSDPSKSDQIEILLQSLENDFKKDSSKAGKIVGQVAAIWLKAVKKEINKVVNKSWQTI